MTKNNYSIDNRIDALDTLREWLYNEGVPYGELKPTLTISDNIVTDVKIHRGDELIHLRQDTKFKKISLNEDLHKPHI